MFLYKQANNPRWSYMVKNYLKLSFVAGVYKKKKIQTKLIKNRLYLLLFNKTLKSTTNQSYIFFLFLQIKTNIINVLNFIEIQSSTHMKLFFCSIQSCLLIIHFQHFFCTNLIFFKCFCVTQFLSFVSFNNFLGEGLVQVGCGGRSFRSGVG